MQKSENMGIAETKNYGGIFLSCFAEDGVSCTEMVRDHTLTYVYSGEVEVNNNGNIIVVGKNQCVFIRRDHRIKLTKRASGDEQYMGISLTFHRNFLRDFYNNLNKKDIPQNPTRRDFSILKINERPDITSLFESLQPYINSDMEPSEQIIEMKRVEGIYVLLNTEEAFFPLLFDFTEPWKIDLMQFMNDNYMYDLSMEEIASFTGRSLATFKRDFAKVSDLPPQKWIIRRRLQSAYDKLQNEGKKPSDVYIEVGFKDISHFYYAFKRQYGFSPRK